MTRRGVKRPAVRVRWELEEYTLKIAVSSAARQQPLHARFSLRLRISAFPTPCPLGAPCTQRQ